MEGGIVAVLLGALVLVNSLDRSAGALLLRREATPTGLTPGASLQQPPQRQRSCKKSAASSSFAELGQGQRQHNATTATALGLRGVIVADGYSRVACEVDIAPESQRLYFQEHACGDSLSSCRLTTLAMQPRLCFDFCRQFEKAKFFGLKGSKCYCSEYYHAKSTGGQGTCSFACEGDQKEMCGGPETSSLFEMHLCADSGQEATLAMKVSEKAAGASTTMLQHGAEFQELLHALSFAWDLGACAIEPEGARLCSLASKWNKLADVVNVALVPVQQASTQLLGIQADLANVVHDISDAGKGDVASLSKLELLSTELQQASIKTNGAVEGGNRALQKVVGPLSGAPLSGFTQAFSALGDVPNKWHSLCGLVPMPDQLFAATETETQAACGAKCLSFNTGLGACVAFNYVERAGLSTCQLLTSAGLLEPADSLVLAVPILEVSQSKVASMGITTLGCYAHGAFMAGHKQGPLKTQTIASSTVGVL